MRAVRALPSLLLLLTSAFAQNLSTTCRWASKYTQTDILQNYTVIETDLLVWEGRFHADNVGYNSATGLTYDGTTLDLQTGQANASGLHHFSAASKEAIQIMLYARAINGSAKAALVLSPNNTAMAPAMAVDIMGKKLQRYQQFNASYPGYAGFMPWFLQNGSQPLNSTADWYNRVPALDNGENIWAIYAFVEALRLSGQNQTLQDGWQAYLDNLKTTAATVFYKADNASVCAVTSISDVTLPVNSPNQTYRCESNGSLNDPYEGELFTYWLDLFGNLSSNATEALWAVKRPQLVAVNYTLANNTTGGPITVRKGYWFSAHEEWNILELPYLQVPLVRRVFYNNQRARTCNSASLGIPGLYASVNNSTNTTTGDIIGYISNAGIPTVANITEQELDVITPYGSFPIMFFNETVGLTWWHSMVSGARMQNPYGSTESTRVDGTAVSDFVSWDSKMTTVVAILGGVSDLVASKMRRDGIYDRFIDRLTYEYGLVFGNITLAGEDVPLCLPSASVPVTGNLTDFTSCA